MLAPFWQRCFDIGEINDQRVSGRSEYGATNNKGDDTGRVWSAINNTGRFPNRL